MDEFKDRLQELLRNNPEDVLTICQKTGIRIETMKIWLKGGCYPKAETLLILSDYFGVPVDYLLGRGDVKISLPGIRWAQDRLRQLRWFEYKDSLTERDKTEMAALSNYLALVRRGVNTSCQGKNSIPEI